MPGVRLMSLLGELLGVVLLTAKSLLGVGLSKALEIFPLEELRAIRDGPGMAPETE